MGSTATPRSSVRRSIAASLVVVAVCALAIWVFSACTTSTSAIPNDVQLNSAEYTADLDGDGREETLILSDGTMRIRSDGEDRYQSPEEWVVTDAFVADIDNNGNAELLLVTWKRGSFGTSKPFWIERDTDEMTQHVFVMRFAEDDLEPVWMSSALGERMHDIWLDEENRLHMVDSTGTPLTWEWDYWGFTLVDAGTVSLIAVGDNIAHTAICADAYDEEADRYDFSSLFAPVAERISSYDLAAVCQETILVNDRSAISDYPDFGTPAEMGDALADAGFDIVEAATNHAFDKRLGGVEDTLAFWTQRHAGVTLLGLHATPEDARSVDFVEAGGMRFALFDYTYGLNGHVLPEDRAYLIDTLDDIDSLVANLGQAEQEADLSICFLHIGDEYASAPSDYQRQVVERIVDAGADLVICSHPHVVQPVERLTTPAGAEAVVFWSLGNFASRQTDVSNIVGGAASVTFDRQTDGTAEIASYELLPVVCHYETGVTQVYFLDDYTDELAGAHALSTPDDPLTVQRLYDEFASRVGMDG